MLSDRTGRPADEDDAPPAPTRVGPFVTYARFILGLYFQPRPTRTRWLWVTLNRVGGALVPLSILAYAALATMAVVREGDGWEEWLSVCQGCFFGGLAMRMTSELGNLFARDVDDPPAPLPRASKVFFAIGATVLAATVLVAAQAEVRYLRWPKAMAEVSRYGNDATFVFTVDGRAVHARLDVTAPFYARANADEATIAYDPQDPQHVALGIPQLPCEAAAVFGLAFVLMGFVGRAMGSPNRERPSA